MEIKKFKDLKESDVILGADNKPVRLSEAYKEHIPERMYKLTTSAGTTVNTSGNHLWYVELQVDKALHKRRLRSEEHTSELQSRFDLVCRLLLEKKKH